MAISQTIKRACRRYEQIEAEGLTLYPILVEELEEFTGLQSTRFGMRPVEVHRPPQSWRYVEELK